MKILALPQGPLPDPEDPHWEPHLYGSPREPESDWETHLAPSPQGRLLVCAEYNRGNGDILRRLLDRELRDVALHLVAPGHPGGADHYFVVRDGRAREVSPEECLERIRELRPGRERPRPPDNLVDLPPEYVPEWEELSREHQWNNPPNGPQECATCEARLFTARDERGMVQRARAILPLDREAHYLRKGGTLLAASGPEYRQKPLRE